MSVLPHGSLFMDGTWLLLVTARTAVDLQLLPIRCAVIQLAMNKSRRVSSINLAFLPTSRYSVLEISLCFGKYLFG